VISTIDPVYTDLQCQEYCTARVQRSDRGKWIVTLLIERELGEYYRPNPKHRAEIKCKITAISKHPKMEARL
jgi:hypothetical protein